MIIVLSTCPLSGDSMPNTNAKFNNVILFNVRERVATVTVNRPNELNTFTADVINGLTNVFTSITTDDAIKVAVLTGAGRAFSAGLDLKVLIRRTVCFSTITKS
ncbi:MAG: enoyl-CoA hydratase-related protein, partial [Paraglaciecola sp.]|uniref:enoyl-CoA hydratase/isomerase family protein n=1 Tax=Paraglaciecola sp. TaxID=1920173 RepID=UPI003298A181